MGKATRAVPRNRMSQAQLNALITNPAPDFFEKEHIEPKPVLVGIVEYDTLHPEEKIKSFCADIRSMLSRYEYDKERLSDLDCQMQDLLHYIELSGDKNANAGYKLYKQIAIVRRERRACKNEIDLLQSVYDMFHDTNFLNRLAEVQGKCRAAKQIMDNRGYTVRTDVLEGL